MKLELKRGTAVKIFIIILITEIISIIDTTVLERDINILSENYQKFSEEYYVDKDCIEDINILFYKHQGIVLSHVIATDSDQMAKYEKQEKEISSEISEKLSQFNVATKNSEYEQLYHKVYSKAATYSNNKDIVLKLSREGDTVTADYYISKIMSKCVSDINKSLDEFETYIDNQVKKAKTDMDNNIENSKAGETSGLVLKISAIIVALVLCFNITSNLEKHKNKLENKIETQKQEILIHNEKMLEIQNNIITGMANLIENRDGDTGEHIKRTSAYVGLLANAAKEKGYYKNILTYNYIELLIKAAPMHDIGKICIPDAILKKPGRLTDKEFEIIKKHTTEGERIINEVLGNIEEKEYLEIASEIACGHHEKWNGQGYPYGKKGEEIPLCARIMAIADVFDALISKRCYKNAMSIDEAFYVIENSSGSHFDPILTELFLNKKNEVIKIALNENIDT